MAKNPWQDFAGLRVAQQETSSIGPVVSIESSEFAQQLFDGIRRTNRFFSDAIQHLQVGDCLRPSDFGGQRYQRLAVVRVRLATMLVRLSASCSPSSATFSITVAVSLRTGSTEYSMTVRPI